MADRPVLTLAPVTEPSIADEPKQTKQPTAIAEETGETGPHQAEGPVRAARAPRRSRAASKRSRESVPEPVRELWRSWGPFHQTVSFKWPPELVQELDDRRHDLREPVGLMVIAAVTHLLDHDDNTIRGLIDCAEQAKPRSGRPRNRGR
jgi:hypothetical protein